MSAPYPMGRQYREESFEDFISKYGKHDIFYSQSVDLPENISVAQIAEAVLDAGKDRIILESSNAYEKGVGTADVRGRYSIIALDVDDCLQLEYTAGNNTIAATYPKLRARCGTDVRQFGGIWHFLAQYLESRKVIGAVNGDNDSPFWGGFMGYTTYELGLEGINVSPQGQRHPEFSRPDLCFAWVTRSLVIDHVKKRIHIQELDTAYRSGATPWSTRIYQTLLRLPLRPAHSFPVYEPNHNPQPPTITRPDDKEYESKVQQCQEEIRKGNSYELCLTAQTTVTRPADHAWPLYKSLRTRQPAPFASYIRLGSATLVGSSPERFLSWDESGKCELRPMKGTVRKSPIVNTLAQAKALLDVPKEKAENLMIVDLVRHDLHGVCGSGNVSVPRLMVVEEYATVFQMISIVQGQIPPPTTKHLNRDEIAEAEKTRYTGIDVLAASLPPGSMTGAPKKRSCEILQEIEGGQERSLYSGVVGYMDVRGRGDFSVTIRSMFRWKDECFVDDEGEGMETWHIGAGGAVTALSTPVGEREEMQTKLAGTLGVFG